MDAYAVALTSAGFRSHPGLVAEHCIARLSAIVAAGADSIGTFAIVLCRLFPGSLGSRSLTGDGESALHLSVFLHGMLIAYLPAAGVAGAVVLARSGSEVDPGAD